LFQHNSNKALLGARQKNTRSKSEPESNPKKQFLIFKVMPIEFQDICHTVQEDMINLAESNYGLLKRQRTGLLSALLSPQNTSEQNQPVPVDPGNGKPEKVIVTYMQPDCEDEVEITDINICDEAGNAVPDLYQEVTLSNIVSSDVKTMSETQFRAFCEDTIDQRRVKMINGLIDSVNRKINSGLITLFSAGAGGVLGTNGVNGQNIQFMDGTDNTMVPMGEFQLLQTLEDSNFSAPPILIGSGNMRQYMDLKGIGCCNDSGQQLDRMGNFDWFYDNQFASVFGAQNPNEVLVMAPGAAQFLSINYNRAEFRKVADTFVHDVYTDPISGLTYDWFQKYDDCAGLYKFQLKLRFGLFQPPLTMFKNCDARDGVNFSYKFTAVNGAAEPS